VNERSFALVQDRDQWLRSRHDHTALEGNVVSLGWEDDEPATGTDPATPAGLAFDQVCRLYRSVPDEGRVERWLWKPEGVSEREDLFVAMPRASAPGSFGPATPATPQRLATPGALAIDENDRLFIAERGEKRVLVYDLWSNRLLRRVRLDHVPVDLALDGAGVLVALDAPPRLTRFEARRDATAAADARLGAERLTTPVLRVAVAPDGRRVALELGTGVRRLVTALNGPALVLDAADRDALENATDLDFDGDGMLVIARRPGQDFLRWHLLDDGTIESLRPLRARNYDGAGIARAPDGRILFWTARGPRYAAQARVKYFSEGEVVTFRLDAGEFQTAWGRLFLDACIPNGTEVRVRCVAADEPPTDEPLDWRAPWNLSSVSFARPDLSPLMPQSYHEPAADRLHRRTTGRELPWARFAADDQFETYEAPILTQPGRYLWIQVALRGDTVRTPRVRSLRAEFPSHDLVRRLPQTFSRDVDVEYFLRRYLAIFDGLFGELDGKAMARGALVDPRSTPPELLPWLASFVGLVLDDRWPLERRRLLIENVIFLFRFRGTIAALRRFIALYLGIDEAYVQILEHWRLRGVGGPVLGYGLELNETHSVVGGGFRVGGGQVGSEVADPDAGSDADPFFTHAHRFTVLVSAALTDEQRAVINHILEVHRPAHTIFDVCGVDAGMRLGIGLLVGLTTTIGRTGGVFGKTTVGQWTLGQRVIVGRPGPGTVTGSSRLGEDSRVG
jgi:phage tail-like protein